MERTGNITFSVIVPVYNVQAYLCLLYTSDAADE